MNVHMAFPRPGETGVDPQTEVLVVFEHPFVNKNDCNIKVDGKWAVKMGEVCDGFRTTRLQENTGKVKWGIRFPGGLMSRDILVQGWCFHNCSSVEQRFFVTQAKTKRSHHVEGNWVYTDGGVFCSANIPFSSGVEVNKNGSVKMGDDEWFVPYRSVMPTMDARVVNNSWVFASSNNSSKTWVITPTWMKRFDFGSTNIKITNKWIHAQLSPNQSIHLPVGYEPSFNENDSSAWFSFTHSGKWDMIFSNDIHVWWNKDKIIAKLEPNPFTGESDDILWTKEDLEVDSINSIEVLSTVTLLINGEIVIEPHTPAIL